MSVYGFYNRLSDILNELNDLEISEKCENAEALKTLKSLLRDLTQCVGDYINEIDNA